MLQAVIIRKVSAVVFSKDEMFKEPGSLTAACNRCLWKIRQAEACYFVVANEAEGFFSHYLLLFFIVIQLIFACMNQDEVSLYDNLY